MSIIQSKAMEDVDQCESTNENGSTEDMKEEVIYILQSPTLLFVYKKGVAKMLPVALTKHYMKQEWR